MSDRGCGLMVLLVLLIGLILLAMASWKFALLAGLTFLRRACASPTQRREIW